MAAPLATPDDVLDALMRPFTPFEAERVDSLLDKASALFRQATRQTIDSRLGLFTTNPADPKALDPTVVRSVVGTIVKRYLANVNGVVTKTETSADLSVSEAFALRGDKDRAGGVMEVTSDDLAAVAVVVPMQAGTIMVGLSPTLVAGMRDSAARHVHGKGIVVSEWVGWNGLAPGQKHTLSEWARPGYDAAVVPQ